ncbi:putative Thioredoxin [Leishmania naiffi]|uniref:Thioredoxin n=1 Tax=Leishmania naiffi TaxID=5678 RepID=A0AAW3C902_9TRYP
MHCTPHAKVATVTLIAVALLLFVGGTADASTADEASRVVELTRDTFDAHVSGPDKYTFVLYCVKWSRQCKTMIRLWDRLSISQSKKELREVFTAAYVDGDKYPDLVERVNVKGFPTMLFYTPLHTEGLEYNGPRESYLLDSFVFQFS